ncbi:MAG: hypothetical protein P8Y79_12825 [Ignavibacteriaceae bacterium]
MKKVFIAVSALFILLPFITNSNLLAQEKPIQLALFNPVQIAPEESSITGLRLSLLYGKNANMNGIDLGLVNITTGDQLGVQWGVVGYNEGNFNGWQDNLVSITKGNFVGLQSGAVTYNASKMNGLQIAVVNYAATLHGLQLGLINIIGKGGFLPVFPIFNFSFE